MCLLSYRLSNTGFTTELFRTSPSKFSLLKYQSIPQNIALLAPFRAVPVPSFDMLYIQILKPYMGADMRHLCTNVVRAPQGGALCPSKSGPQF
jgi:hypothetical protein